MTEADGCGGHAGIGEDLRALVLTALDRIDPVLDRLRSDPADGDPADGDPTGREPAGDAPEMCASCPICAVIAALRGERPELAARLAEHVAGLVAVLRTALEDGAQAPAATDATDRPPARRVQHIMVERPSS